MAFTPTSVMIKSSEIRNFGKSESVEVEHNINLTPSHIQQPPAARFNYRPGEVIEHVFSTSKHGKVNF